MDAVLQVVSPTGSCWPRTTTTSAATRGSSSRPRPTGPTSSASSPSPRRPTAASASPGASDFVYRLTLTTGGFLDYAFPLAVGRDGPRVVEAIGWNIPAAARLLPIPERDARDAFAVSHASLAGTAEVRRVPFAAAVETEPNDLARPQAIASPVALSGRIDPPGDRDVFRLSLQQGRQARDPGRVPRPGQAARSGPPRARRRRARSSPSRTTPAGTTAISSGRSRPRPTASTGSSSATSTAAAVLDSPIS